MDVHDHPGCCGAAAKLPKKPGIQKLTPSSSAKALFGFEKIAAEIASTITAEPKSGRRRYCDPCIESPCAFLRRMSGDNTSIASRLVLIRGGRATVNNFWRDVAQLQQLHEPPWPFLLREAIKRRRNAFQRCQNELPPWLQLAP